MEGLERSQTDKLSTLATIGGGTEEDMVWSGYFQMSDTEGYLCGSSTYWK